MFLFTIIGIMLSGIGIGYLFRRKNLNGIHKVITVLIWILLYLLGMEVGNNQAIIEGLQTIGTDALVITVAAVTGSACFAWLLWRFINPKKERSSQS